MEHQMIFIGGLHRSGTSLLHEILRSHPEISGITGTSVHRDEGQHLQTVYKPAKAFGGMARFGFNKASFMDENHELATSENAQKLMLEWGSYWDMSKPALVEKSPPNLVRSRFLQKLFPNAKFIVILRHPVAVALAAKKWSRMPLPLIIEHNLRCYERLQQDLPHLEQAYVLRYEDFVLTPQENIQKLFAWLEVEPFTYQHNVQSNVNEKYFAAYRQYRSNAGKKLIGEALGQLRHFEQRANTFGYSFAEPERLLPVPWLGPQHPQPQQTKGAVLRHVTR